MTSRFQGWPVWSARCVLMIMLLLSIYGGWSLRPVPPAPIVANAKVEPPNDGDPGLYRAIVERMRKGEGYYAAAAAEQRARGYPLKPFVTMRLPTLAILTTALGGVETAGLWMKGFIWFTLALFGFALSREMSSRVALLAALGIMIFSAMILMPYGMQLWHESWAVLLLMCAFGCQRLGWVWPALFATVTACLIRELVAPFLLVMAFCALLEGKRRESIIWIAGFVPVALALILHKPMVEAVGLSSDLVSPGWSAQAGWPILAEMAATSTSLVIFGKPLAGALLPFALLGWIGWRTGMGVRVALYIVGMSAAFMLFARNQNMYWMLMLAPLLPMGLAFCPAVLRDLLSAARPK